MLRILCDLDGVVVDTLPTWLLEYRAVSGDMLNLNDIKEYNFEQFAKFPELFMSSLRTGDVFRRAYPMPDACAGFSHLCGLYDVTVVTYVTPHTPLGERDKRDWMAHWFPSYSSDNIIFAKRKELVDGDILIEDNPHNMEKWLEAHPDGIGYLIDQPYNKKYLHRRCVRAKSVMDVVMRLQDWERGQ